MPFNFQLLLEFFFSGVITLISIVLLFGIVDPVKTKEFSDILKSVSSSQLLLVVFIGGLFSYYLGTVVNALSNYIIRKRFASYRIKMIRRKLGLLIDHPKRKTNILKKLAQKESSIKLGKDFEFKSISELGKDRRDLINELITTQVTEKEEDKLKELYTAVRNYCGIHSEQTNRMISYHWGLLRLSRATILPLIILLFVLLVRLFVPGNETVELFSLILVIIVLFSTINSYRYREKFLIYTVFDIFFISQKTKNK